MARTADSERRKRPWRFLGTLAYLAVASVVLLEVALRVLSTFPGSGRNFTSDPEVGFRVRPHWRMGALLTNAAGFNDVERPRDKAPGVIRVAFVGDSFVFGVVARKDNLVSAFQRLAERDGRSLEALNLGIPAAGPESYLGLVRYDAAELSADVVCVVFFVGNDVFQAHPDFVTRVWLGSPRTQLRSPWRVGPSGDYFYAYKMLRSGTRWLRNRLGRASGETFSRQIYLEIELRSLPVCRVEPDAGLEAGYRHAVELLAEMKAETERRGQGFLVVLAPDRFQIEEELRTKLLALAGESADRYDFDRPQTRLSAALEPLDVEVLDLLPAFREFAAAEALYLRRDTHWNARGNALAAEAVYRFVTERLDGPGLL